MELSIPEDVVEQRRVLLVDGNSICWRAFHVSASLEHKGERTGMSFVFLRMLHSVALDLNPGEIWIAWDVGKSEFRTKLYPAYKQHRPRTEETRIDYEWFNQQQKWLSEAMLPVLKVKQVSCKGWEADDLVAYGCLYSIAHPKTIFSGDRDLWQLMDKTTSVICPNNGWVTIENMAKVCSSKSPQELLLRKVLRGDSSDNIPGIGGVGEKRTDLVLMELTDLHRDDLLNLELLRKASPTLAAVLEDPVKEENFERNVRLMDLRLAARFFRRKLKAYEAKLDSRKASWDPDLAFALLEDQGMTSIAGNWLRWLQPFGDLV